LKWPTCLPAGTVLLKEFLQGNIPFPRQVDYSINTRISHRVQT
jgi:hypothetical protein